MISHLQQDWRIGAWLEEAQGRAPDDAPSARRGHWIDAGLSPADGHAAGRHTAARRFQARRGDRFRHPAQVRESWREPQEVDQVFGAGMNGDDLIGRVVEETDQTLVVMTDPISSTKVEVLKSDVTACRISKISPMPEGFVNFMNEDQILDLIAYLQSGGKKTYAAFKK